VNFFSFFDYLNREVFTQDASYLPDTAKIAATEEWTLNEFKQRLVCAGFKVSEEEVSSSHSELKKERKVIEQLKILYKVIGCNREEEQLLVKISVMPSMPFPFSKAKNWLRDSYR